MPPTQQQQTQPSDQLGDIDPLELEDQEVQDEEVGELAHIEDDAESPDAHQKVADEEQDLAKVIDAVIQPVEVEIVDAEVMAVVTKPGAPAKKSTSHLISKELIDKELTFEDLCDDGEI